MFNFLQIFVLKKLKQTFVIILNIQVSIFSLSFLYLLVDLTHDYQDQTYEYCDCCIIVSYSFFSDFFLLLTLTSYRSQPTDALLPVPTPETPTPEGCMNFLMHEAFDQ